MLASYPCIEKHGKAWVQGYQVQLSRSNATLHCKLRLVCTLHQHSSWVHNNIVYHKAFCSFFLGRFIKGYISARFRSFCSLKIGDYLLCKTVGSSPGKYLVRIMQILIIILLNFSTEFECLTLGVQKFNSYIILYTLSVKQFARHEYTRCVSCHISSGSIWSISR